MYNDNERDWQLERWFQIAEDCWGAYNNHLGKEVASRCLGPKASVCWRRKELCVLCSLWNSDLILHCCVGWIATVPWENIYTATWCQTVETLAYCGNDYGKMCRVFLKYSLLRTKTAKYPHWQRVQPGKHRRTTLFSFLWKSDDTANALMGSTLLQLEVSLYTFYNAKSRGKRKQALQWTLSTIDNKELEIRLWTQHRKINSW